MEPKIEVLKVVLGRKGKVLAYFTARITFGEGEKAPSITLPDLRILEGSKGRFIAAPRRRTREGKFVSLFYPNKALLDALSVHGLEALDKARLDEKWTLSKKGKVQVTP